MQIRRAGSSDFLEIASLDRDAWNGNSHSTFIPDGEHVWRIWTEHAIVFCAEEDRMIGVIVAFPTINGQYCIHKVFVKGNVRKKGVGTQLFKALLEEIDKMGLTTFLTVDPKNAVAISLYEQWGFVDRSFIKGYYRDEEDRYILSRYTSRKYVAPTT